MVILKATFSKYTFFTSTKSSLNWLGDFSSLQTSGSEVNSLLTGRGPQWAVAPRDYYNYVYFDVSSYLLSTKRSVYFVRNNPPLTVFCFA